MPMASRISGKTNETTKFAAHSENTEMPVHAALYCGGKISELSTQVTWPTVAWNTKM